MASLLKRQADGPLLTAGQTTVSAEEAGLGLWGPGSSTGLRDCALLAGPAGGTG